MVIISVTRENLIWQWAGSLSKKSPFFWFNSYHAPSPFSLPCPHCNSYTYSRSGSASSWVIPAQCLIPLPVLASIVWLSSLHVLLYCHDTIATKVLDLLYAQWQPVIQDAQGSISANSDWIKCCHSSALHNVDSKHIGTIKSICFKCPIPVDHCAYSMESWSMYNEPPL
jgi:hypothetical protein